MSEVNMVSEVIIVAIITGVCSVIGQFLISRANDAKKAAEDAAREARLDERLKGVEKRLDTHNNYAEKIGQIQIDLASLATEIKNLKESA